MSYFITDLIDKDIDSKYYELHEPFMYYSDNLKDIITVPVGFVYDHESVPFIKGTSNRGGCIHDYLCRVDNEYCDIVNKQRAADIYFEVMKCRDNLPEYGGDNLTRILRRNIKSLVVKYWPSRFFHLSKVNATYEEIRNR